MPSKLKLVNRARNRQVMLLMVIFTLMPAFTVMAASHTAWLELAGHRFHVDIAATPHDRRQGLMGRSRLAADAGMWFVFDDLGIRTFWMKNTLIPLDILFFNEHRQLVDALARLQPCRTAPCPSYSSNVVAKYALEVPAGTTDRLGIRAGDIAIIRYKKTPPRARHSLSHEAE